MVSRNNILITGANGQLGKSIKEISKDYQYNFIFKEKKELDLTNFINVQNFLKQNKVNSVINCAAYTDVESSEDNQKTCEKINDLAVGNIAKLCNELDVKLIHISTDYVFDGFSSIIYNEENETNPQTYYGRTKLGGEKKILNYNLKNSVIIRTSWLYSKFENNFVHKILFKLKNNNKISVVDDEIGSPTNAHNLAVAIMDIFPKISNGNTEIYHYSNLGFCSRYQFAHKINELIASDCKISPCKQKISNIKRPKFSALDSSKIIKHFQLKIETWEISLKNHLNTNKINLSHEI